MVRRSKQFSRRIRSFTLIELLTVIFIISLLVAILLPVLAKARQKVHGLMNSVNQREVVRSVLLYGSDNQERLPESVATIGQGNFWNWTEPMMLTGDEKRTPVTHRALSEYLGSYINETKMVYCTNAPSNNQFLEQAWRAGDDYDNPQTFPLQDPLSGTYCFYWNYIGYLGEDSLPFQGPRKMATGRRSHLLISDYVGYDHWRSPDSFGSCERFRQAKITRGTTVSSDYWSARVEEGIDAIEFAVNPQAGWLDGHVENLKMDHCLPMWVSLHPDGTVPYPQNVGPGVFFLPRQAVK